MKQAAKRILSATLSVLMTLGFIVTGAIQASAAVFKTYDEAKEWIDNREGVGYKGGDNVYDCPDLVNAYISHLLNGSSWHPGGNANAYYNASWSSDYFEKIPYSAGMVPQKGDIICWNYAQWGHVAIDCGGSTSTSAHVIQQATTQNKPTYKGYVATQGNSCQGFVRPKFMNAATKPALPAVSADRATVQEGEQITIRWNAVPGATHYTVYLYKLDFGASSYRDVGFVLNGPDTSYTHGAFAGTYDFYVAAYNSAGSSGTTKVTVEANPSYPTAPKGFTDVTGSFANTNSTKKITLKAVQNGKYVYTNNQPFLIANSDTKDGSREEFTVVAVMENGTWTGNVALQSTLNNQYVRVQNGYDWTAVDTPGGSLSSANQFRIYRNDANGYYYLRVKSTGNYIAVNMDDGYRPIFQTTSQPSGDGAYLAWERFEIEVKPAYAASSSLDDGYYAIKGKTSGKYVSAGNTDANGYGTQLYEDGNGSAPGIATDQQFQFTRQADGTYSIMSRRSNKVLTVAGGNLINGTDIHQWEWGNGNG